MSFVKWAISHSREGREWKRREGNGREGKEITLLVILDECVECNDCQAFLFNLASSLESGELQDEPCAILEKAAGISAL